MNLFHQPEDSNGTIQHSTVEETQFYCPKLLPLFSWLAQSNIFQWSLCAISKPWLSLQLLLNYRTRPSALFPAFHPLQNLAVLCPSSRWLIIGCLLYIRLCFTFQLKFLLIQSRRVLACLIPVYLTRWCRIYTAEAPERNHYFWWSNTPWLEGSSCLHRQTSEAAWAQFQTTAESKQCNTVTHGNFWFPSSHKS